jgi:hypothetical protein
MTIMNQRSFKHNGILITRHAQERAAERTVIASSEELADKAFRSLTEGIDVLADPILRELAIKNALMNENDGLYCLEGVVFVYKEATVVTVYPVAWLANYNERGYVIAA